MKVHKLPESLIRLIAAGEVIERPASVVKELVENSLDAGATQITIEIWGAGRTNIRVTDNGEGMTREDAELALDRHATSKLSNLDDLHKIMTFGFRGEALPSIAAVSRLELTTCTVEEPDGFKIKLEGGKVLASTMIGAPKGTTINVADLFFNTPARSKFLKRDSTERSHILRTLQELALAHPQTGFDVTLEGKSTMNLPQGSDIRLRLIDLWGSETVSSLLWFEFDEGAVSGRGFINKVPAHSASRNTQYLFVNGRPVQQRALQHAIYEAYHEWLPIGRHPVFALFIEVDPAIVDVNVHPTKREVRFSKERMLYDLLYARIRKMFEVHHTTPLAPSGDRARPTVPYGTGEPRVKGDVYAAADLFQQPSKETVIAEPLTPALSPLTPQSSSESVNDPVAEAGRGSITDAAPIRILGQFNEVYVLAEQGNELLIIDQHAAGERVMYEKLLKRALKPKTASQPLLTPYIWELANDQAVLIEDLLPDLRKLGFEIESFGGKSFALKALPADFPEMRQVKRFLDGFLDSIQTESSHAEETARHAAVARAACRAAVKANDYLALEEMSQLLKELAACERPMTCPHGRPTHIRLPLAELHRKFRRT